MATSFDSLYVRPDLAGWEDFYANPVVLPQSMTTQFRHQRDGLRGTESSVEIKPWHIALAFGLGWLASKLMSDQPSGGKRRKKRGGRLARRRQRARARAFEAARRARRAR